MLAYIYSWIYPVSTIPQAPTLQPMRQVHQRPIQRPIQHHMQPTKLEDILSVKLRKVDVKSKTTYYEPRHPVLRELMKTTSDRDVPPAV